MLFHMYPLYDILEYLYNVLLLLNLLIKFIFNVIHIPYHYTLSLHDALPISPAHPASQTAEPGAGLPAAPGPAPRSEEHTSELQSRGHLVCRLLIEKKKIIIIDIILFT